MLGYLVSKSEAIALQSDLARDVYRWQPIWRHWDLSSEDLPLESPQPPNERNAMLDSVSGDEESSMEVPQRFNLLHFSHTYTLLHSSQPSLATKASPCSAKYESPRPR